MPRKQLFSTFRVKDTMKWMISFGIPVLIAGMACNPAWAQAAGQHLSPEPAQTTLEPQELPAADLLPGPVVLEWTPPALAQLSSLAAIKSSFTLDRAMLGIAAGLLPDSENESRQAIRKLDGVSVHVLRFGAEGIPNQGQVESIREAYHLRGWKHLLTTTSAGGPLHNGTTDIWLVLDGANARGAVVLLETPRSLTLVTLAGNLNPVDLLHLRGHFGIPRFEGDGLKDSKNN